MSKLFDYYKSMLAIGRMVAEEDGSVKAVQSSGAKKTHFVKGKPLKMPYASVLNDDSAGESAIFHPFGESTAKPVSEVLEDLNKRVANTLGLCIFNMLNEFCDLAAAETREMPLDPTQAKLLTIGRDIDAKVAKSIKEIVVEILTNPESSNPNSNTKWPIKIFLARHGQTSRDEETRHYVRWANVSFPLYYSLQKEIENKPDKGNGRKFAGKATNEKTLRAFAALLEYIFPSIGTEGWYNQGSDNEVAPFAHAWLKGVQNLALPINEKIEIFGNIDGIKDTALPTDWMGAIDDMNDLCYEIGKIPTQGTVAASVVRQDTTQTTSGMSVGSVTPSTQAQLQQKLAEGQAEHEYITGPDGRMKRNPNFIGNLQGGGAWGMMQRVNPFDPRASGMILPASTQIVSNNQVAWNMAGQGAGFGQGTNSGSRWG